MVCGENGIKPVFPVTKGIEAVQRVKNEKEFTFVLNHNKIDTEIIIPGASLDLITGRTFSSDELFLLNAAGVLILVKNQSGGIGIYESRTGNSGRENLSWN